MSWAQLANRPGPVSPPYNPYNGHPNFQPQPTAQFGSQFNNANNFMPMPFNNNQINSHSQQQYRPPPRQQNQQHNTNSTNHHYNPPIIQPNQHRIGGNAQRSNVEITNSKRKHRDVQYVILDSGAFIGKKAFFNNFNENVRYYMTPAVNNEIRDKGSRQFLDNFPYEIIVKKPDPQSVAFVSRFIQKNPSLRSLSKVDRGIVALAHNLEVEYHGTKHCEILIPKKKKNKQQNADNDEKIQTNANNKSKQQNEEKIDATNKRAKKSKTGRVHTQTKPLNDTGVRLAMLKKIVPFNFDDFMTMKQKQYGDKHGRPTPPSDELALIETKSVSNLPMQRKKIDAKKKEIGFDPTPYIRPPAKAKTEIDSNASLPDDIAALSKAAKRRQRKKFAQQTKNKLLSTPTLLAQKYSHSVQLPMTTKLTGSNLLSFGMLNGGDNDSSSDSDDNADAMMKKLTKKVERDKKEERERDIDSKSQPEKSEIDKMIEEDLSTTFNETAHLISSLSAQRTIKSVQYRLHEQHQQNPQQPTAPAAIDENEPTAVPSMDFNSQSLPVHFGTMFDGQSGSLFGNAVPSTQNLKSNKQKVDVMPAIVQEQEDEREQVVVKDEQPKKKKEEDETNVIEEEIKLKANLKDAWQGEWLTPENFVKLPKNEGKKKRKLKNVQEVKNLDSSVAVITVDTAMQRCMVNMGLRVMSTSSDRAYGNRKKDAKTKTNGDKTTQEDDVDNPRGDANGGEPVQWVFRCYGCFQFENNTTRTHCRWCGGQTFQRVAIYQDNGGQHHYRYYYQDRYATRYLDKHQLVPRGSQLVKNHQKNGYQNTYNHKKNKKRNKKRGYLGGGRGFNSQGQRW